MNMVNSAIPQAISLADRQPAPLVQQLLAILVGSISAIAVNVVFYLILTKLFGIPMVAPEQFPPPELSLIPVTDVVLFSVIFSFGASLVFLAVASLSRRPAQVFLGISLVVLIISLFLPFRMPRPPVPISTPIVLASMHVLGAAVLVPILVAVGLRSNRDSQKNIENVT
jgi:hypothetical protein